ncbi:MAG: flagellar export protein FliJ [Candidatus Wallbacteria bacterium]
MKKFVFNLELVLKLRKKEEEKITQELAAAQIRYQQIMEEIKGVEAQISLNYANLKKIYSGNIDIAMITSIKLYLEKLKRDRAMLEEKAEEAASEVEEVKKRLLEAVKNRKIIEKHKENEYEKYRAEFLKNDNLIIDEISSNMKTPHL